MPSQWEGPNFDPHSSENRGPIDLKLQFKKHVRGTTPHVQYGKDQIRGVGGANTQFVTTLVLPFFLYSSHAVLAAIGPAVLPGQRAKYTKRGGEPKW